MRLPFYHINAVARRVGLNPATLRAREGSPWPCCDSHGYCLYSEEDVRVLHWLKSQVERGVRIHHAVALLPESQTADDDPALESLDPPRSLECFIFTPENIAARSNLDERDWTIS